MKIKLKGTITPEQRAFVLKSVGTQRNQKSKERKVIIQEKKATSQMTRKTKIKGRYHNTWMDALISDAKQRNEKPKKD